MCRMAFTLYGLFLMTAVFGQDLNVRDFGATGDGTTDDTKAINKALKAAGHQKKSLHFPAGTYLCNTISDEANHILLFQVDNLQGTSLYGDGDSTRITTSLNTGTFLLFVYAYANCDGLSVKNIFFENTHTLIPSITNGLYIYGTNNMYISNVLTSGCRFEGFCNAVNGQGIKGWTLDSNNFGSPKGHDDAMNNTHPAVYCWFSDNVNGYCTNIVITNNTADGYTGTDPITSLVTQRAMDGFIYGTAYGFTITGNTTRNFSQEHYVLQPRATFPKDTTTSLISNNTIDGTMPLGSVQDNGAHQRMANYGIRCDIGDAVITNNTIQNYTVGIMVRGLEYPKADIHTYLISGNKLFASTDPVNYFVQPAISVQGKIGNRVKDVTITNNEIHIGPLNWSNANSGILLYDVEKATIENNTVSTSSPPPDSSLLAAFAYHRVGRVVEQTNTVLGMKFRIIQSPTDTVQIITDHPFLKN
jgi:hypothetical protein